MPWRSASSGCARSASTAAAGASMHVAELRVVADLAGWRRRSAARSRAACPAITRRLSSRSARSASSSASKPGGDRAAIVQPRRQRIGQRARRAGARSAGSTRRARRARRPAAAAASRRAPRRRPRPRASPSRTAARSRGRAAAERQPAERAGHVRRAAQRRAQPRGGVGLGQQPGPAILPRRDRRRIGQRCREPGREQPRARRGQRALHRGEQRVRGAAVARADDLEAGPRRARPAPACPPRPAARGATGAAACPPGSRARSRAPAPPPSPRRR